MDRSRGQLGLGLGAQAERAADALYVHADHARSLLSARERGDRHAREVAHRALRAVAQRGGDLCAQPFELFVGQLVEIQPAGSGLVGLLAHVLADRRELDRAEHEAVEHQLEHAPILLALGERRRERLAEVVLLGPVDLAQHRERVQQLRGADRHAFAAQLLAQLQHACGEPRRGRRGAVGMCFTFHVCALMYLRRIYFGAQNAQLICPTHPTACAYVYT